MLLSKATVVLTEKAPALSTLSLTEESSSLKICPCVLEPGTVAEKSSTVLILLILLPEKASCLIIRLILTKLVLGSECALIL